MKVFLALFTTFLLAFTLGCGSRTGPEVQMEQEQQTEYDDAGAQMMQQGGSAGQGSPDPTTGSGGTNAPAE